MNVNFIMISIALCQGHTGVTPSYPEIHPLTCGRWTQQLTQEWTCDLNQINESLPREFY